MPTPYHAKALPEGTLLREWRLETVLGVGGFGIVYRGRGTCFGELVAIKEYFPSAICERTGATVAPTDSASEEIYKLGLQKFVEEAKVLWTLSQPARRPNIVSVRSLFEINGTAYMVMDFESGVSLGEMLQGGRRLDEASLMALLRPIGEGLARAHAAGVVHRDIKPANILVAEGGRPVLIDFASARFEAGQATSTQATFYTPPYAALEQYVKSTPQGPWTDIYALGVVLYQCVTGEKPPEVLERLHGGQGAALAGRDWPGFSRTFTRAVDTAMAIRPAKRPQSIEAWLALFDAPAPVTNDDATRIAMPVAATAAVSEALVAHEPAPTPPPAVAAPPEPLRVAARPGPAPAALAPSAWVPAVAAAPSSQKRGAPVALIGLGALALAAAIGGGVWWAMAGQAPHPPAAASAQLPPSPAPAPGPAPSVAPAQLSAADQQLAQAADGLAAEARNEGRPASEVAALGQLSGQIDGLIAQRQAAPAADNAALTTQLNQAAQAGAETESAALDRAGEAKAHEVETTLGGEGAPAGAARVLTALRASMQALDAAVAGAGAAPEAAGSLAAAHAALAAYGRVRASTAAATPLYGAAARARFQTAADAAHGEAQSVIVAAAKAQKPWFLASRSQKDAYKALQDRAAEARADLSELDRLEQTVASSSDVAQINAAIARAGEIRRTFEALAWSPSTTAAP